MSTIHVNSNIQQAINSARKGDLILVHRGIYREKLRINKDYIRVVAAEQGVILDGNNVNGMSPSAGVKIDADGVEIKGFIIRNFGENGIVVKGNQNRIVDNIISNCDQNGILITASGRKKGDTKRQLEALIENEVIEETASDESRCNQSNSEGNLIYHNLIKNCSSNGIKVEQGDMTTVLSNRIVCCFGDGIDVSDDSNGCNIIMNEVACCEDDGIDINDGDNQFISDNKVCECCENGIETRSDYNIIQNNCVALNNENGIELKIGSCKNTVIFNKSCGNDSLDIENKGLNNNITRNCVDEADKTKHGSCSCSCISAPEYISINSCSRDSIACDSDSCDCCESVLNFNDIEDIEGVEDIGNNNKCKKKCKCPEGWS